MINTSAWIFNLFAKVILFWDFNIWKKVLPLDFLPVNKRWHCIYLFLFLTSLLSQNSLYNITLVQTGFFVGKRYVNKLNDLIVNISFKTINTVAILFSLIFIIHTNNHWYSTYILNYPFGIIIIFNYFFFYFL